MVSAKAPYVLQGIHYLLKERSLWKYVICPLFLSGVFATAVIVGLFGFALLPLALALSIPLTPFVGWPLAVIIIIASVAILVLAFSTIVLPPFTDKLFDQVLILRGHQALTQADTGGACCGCLSTAGWIKMVVSTVTLPINFIPGIGTFAWCTVNGRYHSWDYHSHYFIELKGWKFREQQQFVNAHLSFYHLFGTQALALEIIPVIFTFTNTVGSALWVCDVEDELRDSIVDKKDDKTEGDKTDTQQGSTKGGDEAKALEADKDDYGAVGKAGDGKTE